MIQRAMLEGLAKGRIDTFNRFVKLAFTLYDRRYAATVPGSKHVAKEAQLPPFPELVGNSFESAMKQESTPLLVRARIWAWAPAEIKARVWERLGPILTAQASEAGLDPALYQKACLAYDKARKAGRATRSRLVVIDYSRPSTEERLWVFDLERQTLLFKELVAHGKNTGDNTARSFSNVPGSLQTSVGVFVTDDVYRGKHGKSLRLDGLEQGFNDKARERAIVIHGADYVDDRSASKQGRLGRSWGCPALPTAVAPTIIDAIAGGAVVFAWGDDKAWQARSTFLQHGA
jgi:hypothetical protein